MAESAVSHVQTCQRRLPRPMRTHRWLHDAVRLHVGVTLASHPRRRRLRRKGGMTPRKRSMPTIPITRILMWQLQGMEQPGVRVITNADLVSRRPNRAIS